MKKITLLLISVYLCALPASSFAQWSGNSKHQAPAGSTFSNSNAPSYTNQPTISQPTSNTSQDTATSQNANSAIGTNTNASSIATNDIGTGGSASANQSNSGNSQSSSQGGAGGSASSTSQGGAGGQGGSGGSANNSSTNSNSANNVGTSSSSSQGGNSSTTNSGNSSSTSQGGKATATGGNQSQSNALKNTNNLSNGSSSNSGVSKSGNSNVGVSTGPTNVTTGVTTGATNVATGPVSNTNGNSNSNSTGASSSGANVSTSSVYNQVRQAPTAYAPDALPSAPCRVSGSAGVSSPIGGVSLGGSKLDAECDRRETARAFALLGNKMAAARILCNTKAAKEAQLTFQECADYANGYIGGEKDGDGPGYKVQPGVGTTKGTVIVQPY